MTLLLKIIKTVGKVLLWVISAVLILFLILIFCPVFYEIKGEKYDKAKAAAEIKVLFGILKVRFGYDNGGASAIIDIFRKKINLIENEPGEQKENEEKQDNDISSDKPKEKMDKPEKQRLDKTECKVDSFSEKDSQAVKHIPNKTIPEKSNIEKPTVKTQKVDCKSDEKPGAEEKSIVAAEWGNEVAEEKVPVIKKVKFSEIIKEEPDKNKNINIKYVKMPDEDKDEKKSENRKTDNKETNAEEGRSEKLDFEYFKNMPSEEKKKLFSAAIRLLKSLFRGIKPKNFYLTGKIGLSDPALTGQIVGGAWSIGGMLNKRIEIEAVFDREIVEGEFSAKGYIVPAFMMFYIIRFIAVKPVRKIIILLIKGDKNGK